MNIAIVIISILASVISLVTAYFTYKDKKAAIFVCAGAMCVLSIVGLVLQQVQSINSNEEVSRLNRELIASSKALYEYTSGGENNKPILIARFTKREEGGFDASFGLKNFGPNPLQGVTYQLSDGYSVTDRYLVERGYRSMREASKKGGVPAMNHYAEEHREDETKSGTLANLPGGTMIRIHSGGVPSGICATMYQLTVAWNNQAYSASYRYLLNSATGESKLLGLNVRNQAGKEVADLAEFFPLIPKEAWGDFPTKTDLSNKTVQIDCSQGG